MVSIQKNYSARDFTHCTGGTDPKPSAMDNFVSFLTVRSLTEFRSRENQALQGIVAGGRTAFLPAMRTPRTRNLLGREAGGSDLGVM